MNLLLASTRQLSPTSEWTARGVRNLIDDLMYPTRQANNWTLFDNNPDLLEPRKPQTHRLNLHSNLFHHQSVIAFSAAVIAGAEPAFGHPMESFFGPLAKSRLPLLALGLRLFPDARNLTTDERKCLTQKESLIVAANSSTASIIRAQGLNAYCLPCPSLFALKESEERGVLAGSATLKIGWMMTDPAHVSIAAQQNLWRTYARSTKEIVSRVLCTTIDDFLKLSPIFPKEVFYTYDSVEYLREILDCDLMVTDSAIAASLANSCLREAILIVPPNQNHELSEADHVQITTFEKLPELLATSVPSPQQSSDIKSWKDFAKNEWQIFLRKSLFNMPANKANFQTAVIA